jgi:flagellum-specific peptidoglycan hydrolase FlgJ
MLEAKDLDQQIIKLGQSGYATDPEYADKIASIAKGKRIGGLL